MGSRTSFHSLPTRILCSSQRTSNHDPSTPAQACLSLTALSSPLLPASLIPPVLQSPNQTACSGKPPSFHPKQGGMLLLSELMQGRCATRVAQHTTLYSLSFTVSRCQPCHPGPYALWAGQSLLLSCSSIQTACVSDTEFPVTLVDLFMLLWHLKWNWRKLCWQFLETMRLDNLSASRKEINTYYVYTVLLWKARVSNTQNQ